MASKIRDVVITHTYAGESKIRKMALVLGSLAAFLFGIFSIVIAVFLFFLTGDFSTFASVSSVTIQFLIPVAIGVVSMLFGKVLLNKAFGLREWERATPYVLRSFFKYYDKNKITVLLVLIFIVLLVIYFLKR